MTPTWLPREGLEHPLFAAIPESHAMTVVVGFVLWLAYGVALGNAALIVSNAVAITSYAVTTAAVLRLR